jgi:antitoxin (DNA-binding transcriptional repressor) of toxin-antitoxin stability system
MKNDQPQIKIIGITDLRQNISDTVNECHFGKVPIAVTWHDSPRVLLVPIIGTLDEHTNVRELVARALGLEYPEKAILPNETLAPN